jgi:DNA-binding MarR family transcriptional regulator
MLPGNWPARFIAMKISRLSDAERRELGLRNWPDVIENSTGIVRQLLSAVERLRQAFHPHIMAHGIQPGDFDVLVTLRIFGRPYQLSPTAIYRERCLSSGGLTKILHRLENAGLVTRQSNPEDKRGQLIRLTAKGKQVVESTMKDLARLERDLLAGFQQSETKLLSSLLEKLQQSIDAKTAGSG